MSSSYRRLLLLRSFKCLDLSILIFSFGIATILSHQQLDVTSLKLFLAIRISVQNLLLILVFTFSWHLVFSFYGLYDSIRLSSRRAEAFHIVKATTVCTIGIFIVSILFDLMLVSKAFLLLFWIVSTGTTILSRSLGRSILRRFRVRGQNKHKLLIAGTNNRVIDFAEKLLAKPHLGYEVVEFIDTDWTDKKHDKIRNKCPFIPLADLDEYVKHNVVDEVVIGLPIKSQYEHYDKIITICMDQGINVRILADFFHNNLAKSSTESFEGIPVVTLYTGTMDNGALLIKRIMDMILSSVLLFLLSPLFLITMLVIKIDSPGAAVFVQERLGLNKRRFKLYKFRTMVQNAEKLQKDLEKDNEAGGPNFKIANDPRITRVGNFLRKSSIDELPQLLNVLKGDMSLVGPRPLPVRDYNEFDQRWFNRRFSVRPGITCLWQVRGRSDIPFIEWIKLDLNYIDQWSLGLDFKLLLQTIPAVLKASGAR